MCDNESAERFLIDQSLYEPARNIERRLEGERASDAAWDVFFGRSGGAVVWAQFQRVKASYASAAALASLSLRKSKRVAKPRCEDI